MLKEEIHDLLAYDGVKIIQRKDLFRFSLDSLLLGGFTKINPRANMIVDFGTGLGPVPLYLSLKTKKPIYGIEIQKDAVELANKSVELNNLEHQIKIILHDIKSIDELFERNSVDIVTVNPPFFKLHHSDFLNQTNSKALSRHEVAIDLEGILSAAKNILSTGGSFNMIHRANRLDEIILLMNKYNFVMKRMRFVYTKPDNDAMMVLLEAKFNGKIGEMKVEPPLIIYEEENKYSEEVLRIFHLGDGQYEKNIQLPE